MQYTQRVDEIITKYADEILTKLDHIKDYDRGWIIVNILRRWIIVNILRSLVVEIQEDIVYRIREE